MKLNRFLFIVILIIPFTSGFSQMQNFTKAQKEVWQTVQNYWDLYSKGDAVGYLGYVDDSYHGWSYTFQTPMNKTDITKFVKADMSQNTEIMHVLTPAVIWVKGDFSYVDYYYQLTVQNSKGDVKSSGGRWTDILMKKENKWVLIGDQGGQTSK